MTTERLWQEQGTALYFFILKRTNDTVVAEDVLQDTFLKIHENLQGLKEASKAKAWGFQIARNELANYYKGSSTTVTLNLSSDPGELPVIDDLCCFERFLEELPNSYKKVIQLVYLEGKTNPQAADALQLSLANVKARVRRAKDMLKKRFQECCQFKLNASGKLVGASQCMVCSEM